MGVREMKTSRRLRLEPLEPRVLLSSLWVIEGDPDPLNPDDQIIVRRNAVDPNLLEAVVNGSVVETRAESGVRCIKVLAGEGDDLVQLDFTSTSTSPRPPFAASSTARTATTRSSRPTGTTASMAGTATTRSRAPAAATS